MSKFVIYLAGGRDSDWRDTLSQRWRQHDVALIDPFLDSRQGSIYEFTQDDLAHVERADLIFGYSTYHLYTGMALEFGYARALGRPIVYVTTLPRIDSMMVAVASAAFTSIDAAIEHVEQRYLPAGEDAA